VPEIIIAAGPIVRRITDTDAAIWIATTSPVEVTCSAYLAAPPWVGQATGTRPNPSLAGNGATLPFGDRLHVACVQMVSTTATAGLQPHAQYFYDVLLTSTTSSDHIDLRGAGLLAEWTDSAGLVLIAPLGYFNDLLPSFVTPPQDIEKVHLLHGSCRKPHGPGRDELATADDIVRDSFMDIQRRPQALLLTGDQIYSDDVAPLLLGTLTHAGVAICGHDEVIQGVTVNGNSIRISSPKIGPLRRKRLVCDRTLPEGARFSSGHGDSHLISFGEFASMYIFAWTTGLGPKFLNDSVDVTVGEPTQFQVGDGWDQADRERRVAETSAELPSFIATVAKVRRLLANIQVLMVFDDHEVTDDWFLNDQAKGDQTATDLGVQILTNALAAFVVFQGWGNDTAYFASGQGRRALTEISALMMNGSRTRSDIRHVAALLGIVPAANGDRIRYHFTSRLGPIHLVALDTRTNRQVFPNGESGMIGEAQLADQLLSVKKVAPPERLVVISGAPVFGFDVIEGAQETAVEVADKWDRYWKQKARLNVFAARLGTARYEASLGADYESWFSNKDASLNLLRALASKCQSVTVLSGDVHYGFSAVAKVAFDNTGTGIVVHQLVSSSLKNRPSLGLHVLLGNQDQTATIGKVAGITIAVAGAATLNPVLFKVGKTIHSASTVFSFVVSGLKIVGTPRLGAAKVSVAYCMNRGDPGNGSHPAVAARSASRSGTNARWFADGVARMVVGMNCVGAVTFEDNASTATVAALYFASSVSSSSPSLPMVEHLLLDQLS
jgi:hypothetical protein